jgi:phage terminase small subunit
MATLNAKQKLFIKAYLVCKNATKAAIAAGYSEKTAGQCGHEYLRKPEIARHIRMGLAEQEQDLEKKAAILGVTKAKLIEELKITAFADMNDYAKVTDQGSVVFTPGSQLRPGRAKAIRKLSESVSKEGGSTALELHSKDRAQELLCKIMGWTKNDLNLNLNGNVQVILTMPANGSEAKKEGDDE